MRISHFATAGIAMNTALFVAIVLSIPSETGLTKPKKDIAEITVSVRDCRRLIAHRPSAGINHKPGVDVRGRQVAKANLPDTQVIKVSDKITFKISYDALSKLGLSDAEASLLKGDAVVGAVAYDIAKGQLELNGQPLTDPEIEILAPACKKTLE